MPESDAGDAIAARRGVTEMINQRPVPDPIVNMLRERLPKLLYAVLEGENDVYLLMANKKGLLDHAVHYVAGPSFMTAVRVCESGLDNLAMLWGDGFEMTLHPPAQPEGR
jgi:hypothetical protein